MDARLELRLKPDSDREAFTLEALQYTQQVYRPRDGDLQNLQLFADSLGESFDYGFYCHLKLEVFMSMRLPYGGLALIHVTPPRFQDDVHEVYLNGVLMDDSGLVIKIDEIFFDSILVYIFLPQARMQHAERLADCDTVLNFVPRRQWKDRGLILSVEASKETGPKQLEDYFSAFNFLACLERLHGRDLYLHFSYMSFTREMWHSLSIITCKKFSADHMPLSRRFWRHTRAEEVEVGGVRFFPSEREALSGLQSRVAPAEAVRLNWRLVLLDVADGEKWASALR